VTPPFDGPDVSHYQGSAFPWAALVQTHGIRLCACKMTEGSTYIDPTGALNRKAMADAGLRWRGLYHFASPGAVGPQVAHFRGIVGELHPGEHVMIDLEAPMTNLAAACLAVLDAFEDAYPGRVVRYQGKFFAQGDSDIYSHWPWWLPAYTNTLPVTHMPVTLWQWAGGLSGVDVPGVGRVDSNAVIDAATLDRVCGLHVPTPPQPQPEEPFMWGQFVKDDGPGEFWFEGIDVNAKFWCDTVTNLGYDWTVIDLPSLPTKPRAALDAARTKQSRPSAPAAVDIDALLDEMSHRLAT